MSLAEKYTALNAEKIPAVYEAGQKSMVDESKIIEATATGENILLLDDVSEIPHEVEVKVWNKNLLDINSTPASVRNVTYNINGSTITVVPTGASLPRLVYEINVKKNTTYYVSGNFEMANHEDYNGSSQIGIRTGAGSGSFLAVGNYFNGSDSSTQKVKLSFNSGDYETVYFWFYFDIISSTNGYGNSYAIYSDFQIEEGTEATSYTPYVDVSGATLAVYGQNILDINRVTPITGGAGSFAIVDDSIIIDATKNKYGIQIPIDIFTEGTTYTLSVGKLTDHGKMWGWRFKYLDNTYSEPNALSTCVFTVTGKESAVYFYFGLTYEGAQQNITLGEIQVAAATTTGYEPFKKPVVLALDENGEVKLKSDSPNMTFISSVNGAQITADYHKSWGMQTEWDRFWDAYQDHGIASNYLYAFSGSRWNDAIYNPKYPIVIDETNSAATSMFLRTNITDTKVDIEIIYANSSSVFYCSKLKTIRVLKVSTNTTYNEWFYGCTDLETLIIKDTIGQNGFNVQWSTLLSRESITSIINALSTSTSGLTVTLSKTAVNNAFTTDEWNTLIATRSNWTISLV